MRTIKGLLFTALLAACGVDSSALVGDESDTLGAAGAPGDAAGVQRMPRPIGLGEDTGAGGVTATTGTTGGTANATGGTPATGGVSATGGVVGAGGTPATGGVVGTGGANTGGTPATGGMPACVPIAEILNGRDEDCDGVIDNGFAVTQFNGSLYFRGQTKGTWSETRAYCQSIGYDMIVLSSAVEDAYLASAFLYSWIGLTDEGSEGQWRWVDGSPVVYTNWVPGQPSNSGGSENCGGSGTDGWNDLGCHLALRVVCEKVLR